MLLSCLDMWLRPDYASEGGPVDTIAVQLSRPMELNCEYVPVAQMSLTGASLVSFLIFVYFPQAWSCHIEVVIAKVVPSRTLTVHWPWGGRSCWLRAPTLDLLVFWNNSGSHCILVSVQHLAMDFSMSQFGVERMNWRFRQTHVWSSAFWHYNGITWKLALFLGCGLHSPKPPELKLEPNSIDLVHDLGETLCVQLSSTLNEVKVS